MIALALPVVVVGGGANTKLNMKLSSPFSTTTCIIHHRFYNSTPSLSLSQSQSQSGGPCGYQVSVSNLKVKVRGVECRAQLLDDAPFAIAIGASIFTSILSPLIDVDVDVDVDEEDSEDSSSAALSSTDARFAVMTLISFIPYFNCLSWVFALMDTGKPRYAVYALVYLAPYIRTNLSLSPDESWLPISSILLCILHIQLEASITSGDLPSFNFFNEIWKRLGFIDLRRPSSLRNTHRQRQEKSPNTLGKHPSRDDITSRSVPRKPSQLSDDSNLEDRTKH